jgi:hypothetical protein
MLTLFLCFFLATNALKTPGDWLRVNHVTLPKPKLAAIGQGSGDTEQEMKLLSEVKEGVIEGVNAGLDGRFYSINVERVAGKISSAFYDTKGNLLKKTNSRRYTAVMEEVTLLLCAICSLLCARTG